MSDRRIPTMSLWWIALAIVALSACRPVSPDQTGARTSAPGPPSSLAPQSTAVDLVNTRSTTFDPAASPTVKRTTTTVAIQLAITEPDTPAPLLTPIERSVPSPTPKPAPTVQPTDPSRAEATATRPSSALPQSTSNESKSLLSGGASQTSSKAVYRLCGQSDSATAQAIEQFIAGRSYSAQLLSRSGGCPDLTITILSSSPTSVSSGRQSTHLAVTANGRSVTVDIVSENGVTRATIGS